MNIAARPSPAGRTPPDREERSGDPKVRIVLFDDFATAEPTWRRLAEAQPLATPYQRFEWIEHWFTHVGRLEGATPLVVAGLDGDDAPLFILPFVSLRRCGCHVARFCGGNHSNLNMPMWRPEAGLAATQVDAVLAEIAAIRDIDLFALHGQPQIWQGVPNPFAALARQPSPDDVFTGLLDGDESMPHLPSGMRKKGRKLTKLEGFRYAMAATPDEADHILQAFRTQKAARFAKQGIRNVFEDAGVMPFIHAACLDGIVEGRPVIELHALAGAGEVLAIVGGVSNAHRFSVMFNSITAGDYARMSPGIILMSKIVAACAQRGIASYDLGAGQAHYKSYFCSGAEQRFDSFIPFSGRGRLLAAAYQASGAVRRSLKSSPALMNAFQAVRRWTTAAAGRPGAGEPADRDRSPTRDGE